MVVCSSLVHAFAETAQDTWLPLEIEGSELIPADFHDTVVVGLAPPTSQEWAAADARAAAKEAQAAARAAKRGAK
jgi:hypothetical protein